MARDVTLLHPNVQALIKMLQQKCKDQGLKIRITDTLRTKAEQDALYAQGRTKPGNIVTNAKYPYSFHCWGVAFDFCRDDGKGAYYDGDGFFAKVGKVGKSLGLTWGGDWKSLVDKPHFQLDTYGSTANALVQRYGTPAQFMTTWPDKPTIIEEEETVKIDKVEIKLPDGKIKKVDGVMVDDTNYVAIRQVLESLGYQVGWDGKRVIISK